MAADRYTRFTRRTPFGGYEEIGTWRSVAIVQRSQAPTGRRLGVVLMSVLLVAFCASAGRLAVPHIHAAKAGTAKLTLRAPKRAIRYARTGHVGRPVLRRVVTMVRLRELPRLAAVLVAPLVVSRPPGADALGHGSIARSARHKVLGGHGRNGPGATA